MTVVNRLPEPAGILLDRSRTISFTFDGRSYTGFAGDTIASAVAANGQRVLSRSFKYHRPRGVLTMAGHDANTLVELKDESSILADRLPISDGLHISAQNYWGSLKNDRGMILDRFSKFLPVGFYYKTFFRPNWSFKYWEKLIRAMAGIGKVNLNARHEYYDKAYGFCDVAVVGAGPAGLAAALAAGDAGAEVILIDENPILGGSLNYARFDASGENAGEVRSELVGKVENHPQITIYTDAVCQACFAENWLPVTRGNRLYKIRAQELVVCTGSLEQHLIFRNNDLPGIMMGGAAQRLIRLYGVRPGDRAVVTATSDDGYAVALDLLDAGVQVAAIVDLRKSPPATEMQNAVRGRDIPVLAGSTITEAVPGPGKRSIRAVNVAKITAEGEASASHSRIDCDLVCITTGYAPNGALLYHSGAKFAYDDQTSMFAPVSLPDHVHGAGSVNGVYCLEVTIAEGRHVGHKAAVVAGFTAGEAPPPPSKEDAVQSHSWPMFTHPKGKDFVDFDEDLQSKDIINATKDGYQDIQLLKRYSTVGMGPSQGRHSSVPTVRLAAKATGRHPNEVGTTTTRPPIGPINFGHFAGRAFDPVRYTAMHHRHIESGAQMMLAGDWLRPGFYGPEPERDACIEKEAMNVRNGVGLIDVSTLGGLDVRGPDAAEFLNRMYTFAYLKLPVGRARYLLMTDETGVIVDDGVACRFHDNHYYVTATTSGVDAVYRTMLWYNAQWRLDVDVTNVTAAYCGVNIAGPKSRDVLSKICSDVDLSVEAFPYLGVRTGTVAGGIPVRMLRVGFVGELGYELHAPADRGEALWDALMEAGHDEGIKPFGVEAQRMLRLEKGHVIIGQDTDGLTTPHEADMGWAVAGKKPYFVGMRSVRIQNDKGIARKLVGFTTRSGDNTVPAECHLVVRGRDITGRVTSAVYSPNLAKVIGLAFVALDQAEIGNSFTIKLDGGRLIEAEVIPVPFYDPDNKRQEL